MNNFSPELLERITNDSAVRREVTKESHKYFIPIYLHEYIKYPSASFHTEMIEFTERTDEKFFAIVSFRGSAKSTIFSLSYPIWAILGKQQKKFVLLISRTQVQAKQLLHNIKVELERNELLKQDLGPFEEPQDEWRASSIVIPKYDARIMVLSADQSMRGLRHKSHRPDLIICDDIEDIASTKTQDNRDKTFNWFTGEIIPAGDLNTKIVLIGNLVHDDSLMVRLRKKIDDNDVSGVFKAYPLVNNHGDCLWPEKFPDKDSLEKLRKEVMNNFGVKTDVPKVPVKYLLYARKSTESDEKQALSIDSQVKEMLAIAEREQLDIVEIRRESHSAKDSGQRPVFKEILEDIRRERFNGIIVWHPDRLSRNAGDLGSLVDLMDQHLLREIRTYGQTFTNTPSEKFLLMILCSQAKLENDNKSINVKRGLKTRVEMGLWPAPAPTGYLKEKRMDRKCETYIDPERGHVVKQMFEKVAYEKWSGRKLYHWLKFDINFKALPSKKPLSLGNIYKLLENPFYYGVFEYPKKSGNWYNGKHPPLITKELFDQVQSQLKGNELKTRQEKEFAFTKLMTCGLCGSGISADEKYKKLKNGSIKTHIYYGCTKARDKNCKCGYIAESDLVKQLQALIDGVQINETSVQKKIVSEVTRYKRFELSLLGQDLNFEVGDIDIKRYIKFLLKDGSVEEKRGIMSCFKSSILLSQKKITLYTVT